MTTTSGCHTPGAAITVPDGGATSSEAPAPVDAAADNRSPIPTSVAPVCDHGWCWMNPLPHGQKLRAIWLASDDQLWAATFETGVAMLLTRDGWSIRPTIPGFGANAFWGSGPNDIWAVGADWATGGEGETSLVAHFDGASWTAVWRGNGALTDVAGEGADANDVWAVGGNLVLHWDGYNWSTVELPSAEPGGTDLASLSAVWPVSSRDVWIGGYGHIWHWDGAGWTEQDFLAGPVRDLWASGPDDVYAASDILFRWDGTTWSQVLSWSSGRPLGAASNVWAVTGTGPRDVWVGGFAGIISSFDGTDWTNWPESSHYLTALAASSSRIVAAFDEGELRVYDRQTWRPATTGIEGTMTSIGGSGPDDVWFGSRRPAALVHWNGAALESLPIPSAEQHGDAWCVNDVWSTGPGEVWFAGCGGLLGRRTPTGWTLFDETTAVLNSIWSSAPDDAWTVGSEGTVLHWDGAIWQPVTGLPAASPTVWFDQVRGSGRNDVWIAGNGLAHWDGSGWSQSYPGGSAVWANAPDDVWTASPLLSIMAEAVEVNHYDGVAWTSWYVETSALPRLWSPGPGEVWLAGGGTARFSDGAWRSTELPIGSNTIWGTSAADVWAIGYYDSDILHKATSTSVDR
jgi:hypothetical protein